MDMKNHSYDKVAPDIILCMYPVNDRWRYNETSSLIAPKMVPEHCLFQCGVAQITNIKNRAYAIIILLISVNCAFPPLCMRRVATVWLKCIASGTVPNHPNYGEYSRKDIVFRSVST